MKTRTDDIRPISSEFAPIALFAYSRPHHLLKTLNHLKKNEPSVNSELFIFCDGPKGESDLQNVERVRNIANSVSGFKNVRILHRPKNIGLAENITAGVSDLLEKYDRIIVLEDDLITSEYFLDYMNQALTLYKNEDNVASIHGYIYPHIETLPQSFFLKGADCWGWATWSRAWSHYCHDGSYLLHEIKKRNLEYEFNFFGSCNYLGMLEDQVLGKNNSWAVRWYASAFLRDMVTLYPGTSLVQNIGLDGSGSHCGTSDSFDSALQGKPEILEKIVPEESVSIKPIVSKSLKNTQSRWFSFKSKYLKYRHLNAIKPVAKLLLPPAVSHLYQAFRGKRFGCLGDYPTWEEASLSVGGYDDDKILEDVYQSALRVKNGHSPYERDGVVFDEIQYSWPLLSGIMLAAAQSSNKLEILDYGGSLGSTYFQNKKFLDRISLNSWNIIEQDHFVKRGQKEFSSQLLHFYDSLDSCLKFSNPDIIIMSSVLQYIKNYESVLSEIFSKLSCRYIIIDRTPFSLDDKDTITIQKVDPKIYQGSYVCRLLSESNLNLLMYTGGYQTLERFDSLASTTRYREYGYIYEKTN